MKGLKLLLVLIVITLTGCATTTPWGKARPFHEEGWAYYKQGNYDAAIEKFKTAVDLNPSSAHFHWSLGLAYRGNKQFAEAIPHFKKAGELEPKTTLYQTELGIAYYHNQQYQQAIDCFKRAGGGWYYISAAYESLGQIESAIRAKKNELSLKTDNSWKFTATSELRNLEKQYDEAITAAKMAIELKPNARAYNSLGRAYSEKGKYDVAIQSYRKGIEIAPDWAPLHKGIGYAHLLKKEFKEATQAFNKAVELEPTNVIFISRLVLSYYNMGRYDDALSGVNKAISLQERPRAGLFFAFEEGLPVVVGLMAGGAAEKAGIKKGDKIVKVNGISTKGWDLEKFSQSLGGPAGTEVVLQIVRKGSKPFDKTITKEIYTPKGAATSFGIRGSIYRAKGDSDEAMKDAEKAMSLDPDNFWARFSYGTACLDKGRYDETVKALEGETKRDLPAENAQWLIAKATLYAKQGKTKEAVSTYLEISEETISPDNVPAWNDRKVLLQMLKPIAQAHRENARKFEAKGRFQETLNELAGALSLAMDDKEAGEVRNSIFKMVRRMPRPPEISKDARKRALRGEILLKEGDLEDAISEVKKAIRLAPFSAKLYFNTALIYGQLKNYPEAIRYIKIYLQAAPDAPNARAAEDQIIKWELLMERGK